MKQYHIVDLFAGVGGLSYGFSQLPGFRILAANEIEKDIAAAYSLNHPGVKMLNCDIADLTKERLAGALGGQQVDIVVGGPPCQSYSTLGKRRMDDRANLFLQYKRILQILQPQAFIFENVTGILSMDHGRLFQRVESEFRALGYDVRHDILNAVDFGVPQQRERVILVGMKGENNYIFPVPTHGPGKKPYVTLKDAIGDLPQLKSGESASHYAGVAENEFLRFVRAGAGQLVTEHAAPKNGAHLIRIMQTLQDGQSKDDLPEEIRPKSGYGNTYAKLWWERPSITITLFGFDLYTGKLGYWLGQSRQERWQTLLSLPCNAVGCLIAGLARRPAGAVLALCEARLAKAPLILLVDGIFCGILIFICVEIYKTRGTVLGILICIPTFILCGFEHSIADVFYFCNARIFSWQAVLVVLLVALGNALGALIIPAARLVYQPKEEQPHWE